MFMHNNIGIILLRKGSKSIKNKNIKFLHNKPLFYYTVKAALGSSFIKKLIISSDSKGYHDFVKKYFKSKKIIYYKREKANAKSTSSSESAIAEVIKKIKYENYNCFFIQATSPLLKKDDLNKAYKIFIKKKYDSLLSGYEDTFFTWGEKTNKFFKSLNYNYKNRPRRQEFKSILIENGAFYIFKINKFKKYKNRLFGKIGFYKMPKYRSFEVDENDDWKFLKKIIK